MGNRIRVPNSAIMEISISDSAPVNAGTANARTSSSARSLSDS